MVYIPYNNEKLDSILEEINTSIDELDNLEEKSDETRYAMGQLFVAQKKILKKRKKLITLFTLAALLMFILAFVGIF